jgi:ATP-binding cassette subfamily B protein
MALALPALLVAASAQLALPVALRFLIDEGLAVRDAATINRYFVLFLGAGAVFGAFAALPKVVMPNRDNFDSAYREPPRR